MTINHKGKNNPFYGRKHTKITKEKIRKTRLGHSNFEGKKHSEKTKQKMRLAKLGEKSHLWRDGVSKIQIIHSWVVKKRGKAKNYICEFCRENKAIDWSNIDHKYRKKLQDYRALCRSCHKQWDFKFNSLKVVKSNSQLKINI